MPPATTTASTSLQPYLFFGGRCEEAIEFYCRALSAEKTMLLRFKDSPEAPMCPGTNPDHIMHASFRVGIDPILCSDGMPGQTARFEGFSLALNVANEADAKRFFTALADGGKVDQPLTKTFFSPAFGMVTDRFGVSWMVLAMAKS